VKSTHLKTKQLDIKEKGKEGELKDIKRGLKDIKLKDIKVNLIISSVLLTSRKSRCF